ncbi:Fungalysin metallopeptidase-domain-containing protein, partial [Syncephalis fuscata]
MYINYSLILNNQVFTICHRIRRSDNLHFNNPISVIIKINKLYWTAFIFAITFIIQHANPCVSERVNVAPIEAGPLPKYEVSLLSPTLQRHGNQFAPSGKPEDVARAFVRQQLKFKDNDYVVKSFYATESTGVTHVYLKQLFQGIEVANGDISVHVDAKGAVIAYGDGFYYGTDASKRNLWAGQSAPRFVNQLTTIPDTDTQNDSKQQRFILQGIPYAQDKLLQAAWEFFIDLGDNYFNAHVSADGSSVLSLADWISDASYNVLKRTLVIDPANTKASPKGWHDFAGRQTTTTRGNNVEAMSPAGRSGGQNVQPTSANLNFDFPLDLAKEPSSYRPASVTNLFYMNNIMHDVFYQYGFTEAAGNFQNDNYGKGGRGGDYVEANAQDHRYSHGISNRLTGGPANSNCLRGDESGGMGEGWGDFIGIWLRLKATDKHDKVTTLGDYVNLKGIRRYAYSTSKTVNPTTYGLVYKK